ncbi:MAG TPA: hypothetical protein VJV05_14225, partial [Pyrinomonadaceae bacterium]|nr:hypothetical protein [Pyrinomonadaceae bacterium]
IIRLLRLHHSTNLNINTQRRPLLNQPKPNTSTQRRQMLSQPELNISTTKRRVAQATKCARQ